VSSDNETWLCEGVEYGRHNFLLFMFLIVLEGYGRIVFIDDR